MEIGKHIKLTKEMLTDDVCLLLKVTYDLYNVVNSKYNLTNIWKPADSDD